MPGLPCAMVETAYVALSPVRRFPVATVALQLSSDAQVRSDDRTAARLDAGMSGVATTRFCRTQAAPSYTRPLIAHRGLPRPATAFGTNAARVHRPSPHEP